MLATLALMITMQTSAIGGPPAVAAAQEQETLAKRLSNRGVHMLVAISDDEPQARQSRRSARCYSQGEASSGGERVCFYDCGGGVMALPVSSERACPVSYQPSR